MEAVLHQGGARMVDHTPSGADVAAGEVINDGGLVKVAHLDIEDGRQGAVSIDGIYRFTKASGGGVTFAAGDPVEWDDTGNTAVAATLGDFDAGVAVAAAADADDHVLVWLNKAALQ